MLRGGLARGPRADWHRHGRSGQATSLPTSRPRVCRDRGGPVAGGRAGPGRVTAHALSADGQRHGGSLDALQSVRDLYRRAGRRLGVVHLALAGMAGRAGSAETWMMLHLAPKRVRQARVEPGKLSSVPDLLPRLRNERLRGQPERCAGRPDRRDRGSERLLAALLAHLVVPTNRSPRETRDRLLRTVRDCRQP